MISIDAAAGSRDGRARREDRRDWAVGGGLVALILLLGAAAALAPPGTGTPDDLPAHSATR